MKSIRIIAISILVVIGLFYSIGIIYDRVEYTSVIKVKRSIGHTWTVFTSPEKASEWIPNFIRIENISGEPMTAGSRWRLVVENKGEEVEMVETMRQVIHHERFSFDLETDDILIQSDITFKSIDSLTTEIFSKNTVFGKSAFSKSYLSLRRSDLKSQSDQNYFLLKESVESSPEVMEADSMQHSH
jgi:hypothetical protein